MGRLHSGNLNDLITAKMKIESLGFKVFMIETEGSVSIKRHTDLRIENFFGEPIAQEVFTHLDEDVLCNAVTSWLNRIASQLSTWSKY